MLLTKILVAILMLFLCTLIHALFMVTGNHVLEWRQTRYGPAKGLLGKAVLVWLAALWMLIAIVIEASLWGYFYLLIPQIPELSDPQSAFYFSMVTYTTLGYGDLVLSGEWRTLAAIQAGNGAIIFGWTTALIFYFIQQVYKKE